MVFYLKDYSRYTRGITLIRMRAYHVVYRYTRHITNLMTVNMKTLYASYNEPNGSQNLMSRDTVVRMLHAV